MDFKIFNSNVLSVIWNLRCNIHSISTHCTQYKHLPSKYYVRGFTTDLWLQCNIIDLKHVLSSTQYNQTLFKIWTLSIKNSRAVWIMIRKTDFNYIWPWPLTQSSYWWSASKVILVIETLVVINIIEAISVPNMNTLCQQIKEFELRAKPTDGCTDERTGGLSLNQYVRLFFKERWYNYCYTIIQSSKTDPHTWNWQ